MAVARALSALTFATLGFAAAGCGDSSLTFGTDPDFIWWTDHETGDLSEWTGGAPAGGFTILGHSTVEVVKGTAHSGDYALHIRDDSPDMRDFPLAARNGPLPVEVYCSAWYYLPEPVQPKQYWWFMLFRSRNVPEAVGDYFRDEIALSFISRPDGGTGTRVLRRSLALPVDSTELDESVAPELELPVPIARWFHIEVFHRTGSDDSGQLSVWQDGVLTFDIAGPNSLTDHAEWMVGGVVDGLNTPASELYIDDAAITKRRIGPTRPFARE